VIGVLGVALFGRLGYVGAFAAFVGLGAGWVGGLNTSAFYWNLNNASSNRNRNISSQLVNAQISLESPRQKWRGDLINQCTEN